MNIKVNSEIGKLKKVMVHRPGKEVERLYPEIFERLLFDDIMDLKVAQQEHDIFTDLLRKEGVEVYYVEKLVAEALDAKPNTREEFIRAFINEVIDNKIIAEAIYKFFDNHKDNLELVKAMIAGVKKSEIKVDPKGDFQTMVALDDEYPFYLDPIPNILFQRDPIASIFGGMNVHSMQKATRKREAHFYNYLFKHSEEFKDVEQHLPSCHDGSMEGGDVLVINKETIFVGVSERTDALASEKLAKLLMEKYDHFKRVVAIEIPKSHATMHLDTVLTQMDKNVFAIDMEMEALEYITYVIERSSDINKPKITKVNGKIKNLLEKYVTNNIKLVVVGGGEIVRAKREQWNDGANSITIAPGKVIAYSRNRTTLEELRKAGIEVIETASSELSRGRGGPRCMTMPLQREEI